MARSIDKIIASIQAKAGNVTDAAAGLGMTRRGLQKRIAKSSELQKVLADERETLVDLAESKLRENVNKGDMTAIIWTLKANPAAKARGWGERQELTGANGATLNAAQTVVNVYIPDNGRGDAN